ncbi:hypothetical protein Tco_0534262 [Tanacetum coccineum]
MIVRVDEKRLLVLTKRSLGFNSHNTGHFARGMYSKGIHDGKKKRDSLYQHQEARKMENSVAKKSSKVCTLSIFGVERYTSRLREDHHQDSKRARATRDTESWTLIRETQQGLTQFGALFYFASLSSHTQILRLHYSECACVHTTHTLFTVAGHSLLHFPLICITTKPSSDGFPDLFCIIHSMKSSHKFLGWPSAKYSYLTSPFQQLELCSSTVKYSRTTPSFPIEILFLELPF